MTNQAILTLIGASGNKYDFVVYTFGTSFNRLGGVYAITKRTYTKKGSYIQMRVTSYLLNQYMIWK